MSLPVHKRYATALDTLHNNFGQPHMIMNANMDKLKDIQLRRADAPNLMEFARKLEDVTRTFLPAWVNIMFIVWIMKKH